MSQNATVPDAAADLIQEVEKALLRYGGKIIFVCSPKTRPTETMVLTVTEVNTESLTATEEGKEGVRLLNWKDLQVWMVSTVCSSYVYLCEEARKLMQLFSPLEFEKIFDR